MCPLDTAVLGRLRQEDPWTHRFKASPGNPARPRLGNEEENYTECLLSPTGAGGPCLGKKGPGVKRGDRYCPQGGGAWPAPLFPNSGLLGGEK